MYDGTQDRIDDIRFMSRCGRSRAARRRIRRKRIEDGRAVGRVILAALLPVVSRDLLLRMRCPRVTQLASVSALAKMSSQKVLDDMRKKEKTDIRSCVAVTAPVTNGMSIPMRRTLPDAPTVGSLPMVNTPCIVKVVSTCTVSTCVALAAPLWTHL